MTRPFQKPQLSLDPVRRAWTSRRRGDERRALHILREACFGRDAEPRLWALYARQCWRLGRREDACQALRQAVWLYERRGDERRARVLDRLLAAAEHAERGAELRAA